MGSRSGAFEVIPPCPVVPILEVGSQQRGLALIEVPGKRWFLRMPDLRPLSRTIDERLVQQIFHQVDSIIPVASAIASQIDDQVLYSLLREFFEHGRVKRFGVIVIKSIDRQEGRLVRKYLEAT